MKLVTAASVLALGVVAGNLPNALAASGTWRQIATSLGALDFDAVASNSTGRYLAVAATNDSVYTSNDYGATWVERTGAGTDGWSSIAISEDGSKLALVPHGGRVWTSADYGATWEEHTTPGTRYWNYVAASSDGQKIIASSDASGAPGAISVSTDGGGTWTNVETGDFGPVAASADGQYLAYSDPDSNAVQVSSNAGSSWSSALTPDGQVYGIDFSDDGTRITVLDNDLIKVSDTDVFSWSSTDISQQLRGVAMDDDGQNIAVATDDNGVYTSEDFGATWENGDGSAGLSLVEIASDATGERLIAVGSSQVWANAAPIELTDYNNDGTPDEDQPNVSGYTNGYSGKIVAIDVGDDCELAVDDSTSEASLGTQDPAYTFEGGLWEYEADCDPGSTATITLYYYDTSSDGKVLRKFTPHINGYFNLGSEHGLTIEEQTIDGHTVTVVTFQITDGGELDDDQTADGTIIDPVGLASQAVTAPNTGRAPAE